MPEHGLPGLPIANPNIWRRMGLSVATTLGLTPHPGHVVLRSDVQPVLDLTPYLQGVRVRTQGVNIPIGSSGQVQGLMNTASAREYWQLIAFSITRDGGDNTLSLIDVETQAGGSQLHYARPSAVTLYESGMLPWPGIPISPGGSILLTPDGAGTVAGIWTTRAIVVHMRDYLAATQEVD